jgi:hypothetical protein
MKNDINEVQEILPLARTLARELSSTEMASVTGGCGEGGTNGGNSCDGTTQGPRHTDVDLLK